MDRMASTARLQSFLSNSLGSRTTLHHGPDTLSEPSVLLMVAGGTICMQDSADGLVTSKLFLDECLSAKPMFNDGTPCPTTPIVDEHGVSRDAPVLRLPRDRSGANVRCAVLEFDPLLDSSAADAPTWNRLAGCIRANGDSFDAFVICHGTDTLAYSAAALSFLLMPGGRLRKTVILTGAQRSMFLADSDGADNLLGSIVLASHVRVPEVCVYFGHRLLRGTRVTKVSASSYSGFASPNARPLATVSETDIVVHWDNLLHRRPPSPSLLSTTPPPLVTLDATLATLVRVSPCLYPSTLAAMCALPGLRGLVIETFGAGNLPLSLVAPLAAAVRERGLVVLNVTQCLHGSVSAAYEPARKLRDVGVLLGGDMTSEAALTKLLWLLSAFPLPEQRGEVVKGLKADLCGEVTVRREVEEEELGRGRGLAWLPIRYERTTVLEGRESRL